jgi:hypothetical protein
MRATLFILSVILGGCLAIATSVRADVVITPSGMYTVTTAGNTTFVQQVGTTSGYTGPAITPAIPVTPNATTQAFTPSGSYLIINNGATTSVIQTGRTK